jgi:hypothetical protein
MRTFSIPALFFLGSTTLVLGCSFQLGTKPATPPPGSATPATPPPAVTPAPGTPAARTGTVASLGRNKTPPPATPVSPANPATPAAPGGIPVMTGTNVFGQGTADVSGWKASFFVIPATTTKVPALSTMTPNGLFFAKSLDVSLKAMTGGFPGIDPNRNENFAIRFEAPLVVDNEADYMFRVLSDDGAVLTIDGTLIIDNDGVHGAQEKSGPVHLVKGTHGIAVDYFQIAGPVALQLFCKRGAEAEVICPTHL